MDIKDKDSYTERWMNISNCQIGMSQQDQNIYVKFTI